MSRAALAIALLAGCTPALQEGAYTCDGADECPPGWFCHADGRCHSFPRAFGEPCTSDAECATGHCDRLEEAWPSGYCSRICDDNSDCPESWCGNYGSCLRLCTPATPCPAGSDCIMWIYERVPRATIGRCVPSVVGAPPVPSTPCDPTVEDLACPWDGFWCARRSGVAICARGCPTGFACGPGERCTDVGDLLPVCLRSCDTGAECDDTGAPECGTIDAAPTCAPAAWLTGP